MAGPTKDSEGRGPPQSYRDPERGSAHSDATANAAGGATQAAKRTKRSRPETEQARLEAAELALASLQNPDAALVATVELIRATARGELPDRRECGSVMAHAQRVVGDALAVAYRTNAPSDRARAETMSAITSLASTAISQAFKTRKAANMVREAAGETVGKLRPDKVDAEGFLGLNKVERQFFRRAVDRHKAKVWRSGWPDFLVRKDRKYIGVEVKSDGDRVRPAQRRMFGALEQAGIQVFVWDERFPERLIPWRKYIGSGVGKFW